MIFEEMDVRTTIILSLSITSAVILYYKLKKYYSSNTNTNTEYSNNEYSNNENIMNPYLNILNKIIYNYDTMIKLVNNAEYDNINIYLNDNIVIYEFFKNNIGQSEDKKKKDITVFMEEFITSYGKIHDYKTKEFFDLIITHYKILDNYRNNI